MKLGSGQVINQRAAAQPAPNLSASGEATFNFEGESLHAVVKAILGDLLQQNYVIAPNVQGTVTLATPRPVSGAQAMSLLEMVLGWNNARLIWSDGRYNVVPADQAVAGNLSPRTGTPANARGYEVRAVPLKYISAIEMEKLLKPYARDRAIVQVDTARNLIVVAGSRAELQNYLHTIEIFDVDWLSGMSVGVFPLQAAEAPKVVSELEKVFGEGSKSPLAGMFRFMPLEGQNSVMVITSQAKYLTQISGVDRAHGCQRRRLPAVRVRGQVRQGGGSRPATEQRLWQERVARAQRRRIADAEHGAGGSPHHRHAAGRCADPRVQGRDGGRRDQRHLERLRRRSGHHRRGGKQFPAGARQSRAVGIDPARHRTARHHAVAGAYRGPGGRGQADRRT